MKTVILSALVGSAAAFAPAPVAQTFSALNAMSMSDMVGGEGPEPMPFSPGQTSKNFDPAGFAEVCSLLVLGKKNSRYRCSKSEKLYAYGGISVHSLFLVFFSISSIIK